MPRKHRARIVWAVGLAIVVYCVANHDNTLLGAGVFLVALGFLESDEC